MHIYLALLDFPHRLGLTSRLAHPPPLLLGVEGVIFKRGLLNRTYT